MNPFVFIVGCPRSGTTLLQRMVDAHSQIAIVPETHWIARWFEKRKGLTPEGFVRAKLIPKSAHKEHGSAIRKLRAKYPQYARGMLADDAPIIRITPERTTSWGKN